MCITSKWYRGYSEQLNDSFLCTRPWRTGCSYTFINHKSPPCWGPLLPSFLHLSRFLTISIFTLIWELYLPLLFITHCHRGGLKMLNTSILKAFQLYSLGFDWFLELLSLKYIKAFASILSYFNYGWCKTYHQQNLEMKTLSLSVEK